MKKYIFLAFTILFSCNKETAIDMTPIELQGEVLFISRRIPNSADWQMFLMNADGTNQRAISNNIVRCAPPVVSHDGKKVAFTTYGNDFSYILYVIDLDGHNQTLLARAKYYCGSPAWSPDDSRIAFVKNDKGVGGTVDIYSIKSDGTDEIRLTTENGNYSPQYFPDNQSIIFSSYTKDWMGIYKMNTDGSNKQLLTPKNQSFSDPQISPNGNMIAITSNDWNGSQIFVMNADGGNLKQITFTVSPDNYDIGFPRDANGDPVWSPNSDKLAYVSYANGRPDIFIINSNGSGNKRLTDVAVKNESPVWTKDGKYLLFSSYRNSNGANQIYIMRTEGQLQTQITDFRGDNIYPVFIYK